MVASHEPLGEGDEIKLAVQLNRHYPLTVLDPGAAGLTRLLKVTDQLVVVVPANVAPTSPAGVRVALSFTTFERGDVLSSPHAAAATTT